MAARKANPRPTGARGGTSTPARKAASRPAGAPAPAPRHSEVDFPPLTAEAARARGWDQVDFVYVSGDAYVDHPSFGAAIIVRLLESKGFKVGVIAQPDWTDDASVTVFGEPRLGFLVSAGNMDSMVNHYTVAKRRRHDDAYTPGGVGGRRPNHAAVVYGNLIRRTYKHAPIILGGIEASLRRLAHYDYWSDALKRSILLDSGADLVSYGMGERSVVAIAEALDAGLAVSDLTFIPGTVFRTSSLDHVVDYELLPSWDELSADRRAFAASFAAQYANSDPLTGRRLVEPYPHGVYVVQNPPSEPLTTAEMDAVYRLPFTRAWHPSYDEAGGVPALAEVKFSLVSNRGCYGECAFCALTFHQGRIVQARSHESLLEEARALTDDPDFKGYIHDVGGPTADFRGPACADQLRRGACPGKRCLAPEPCRRLEVTHADYVALLRELRALPGVKRVFVRSGIRFDYVMADPDPTFLRELVAHHVSGQLKVAPEHVSRRVLDVMGKPPHAVYEAFAAAFDEENRRAGKRQFLVPYLMSSHPGCTLADAVELAEFCRDMGHNPEQVQDFYPTPGSMATAMYYTGLDPRTMEPVYVPRSPHEKALQRALIQYRNPANHDLVREALRRAHREDLIGYGPKCLVRPEKADKGKKEGAGKAGKGAGKAKTAGRKAGKEPGRPGAPAPRRADDRGGRPSRDAGPRAANRKGRGPAPKANGHKGGIRKQGK
ncbi:YgiQ family radical SAM protein [Adlercreutzia faecimuris]|uniref:YgiQ family radical SAM protein n=1 Tax=Adlercreutzia faecimuris TaxID=2897341 RepID=A0ABS9WJ56_9ACTN|nr:YgiQ family radical SAM protein [Adlercreutzia sp. JBNU-10]MCI2242492.1 YgiQ family radical SAM protein [Adlercreutzia sp. JBNU-10]